MWGEFEDDQPKQPVKIRLTGDKITKNNFTEAKCLGSKCTDEGSAGPKCTVSECTAENTAETKTSASTDSDGGIACDSPPPLSLAERITQHLAAQEEVVVVSQQRYEPDLSHQQRAEVLAALLLNSPGQFLYRFGKHLKLEHLQYFLRFEGDAEVDHYLAETQKRLNPHTARVRVRNRRYVALQRLRREGDYFSEDSMERRDPLLYDQLIAQHQTQHERDQRYREREERTPICLSSMLLEHIDFRAHKELKKRQEEEEDDMFEEEDEDEDEEEMEEEKNEVEVTEDNEKRLYREEFYTTCYSDFLRGKDKDFDYRAVDSNDEYDLLDVQARDEEESYFDRDTDDEDSQNNPSQESREIETNGMEED